MTKRKEPRIGDERVTMFAAVFSKRCELTAQHTTGFQPGNDQEVREAAGSLSSFLVNIEAGDTFDHVAIGRVAGTIGDGDYEELTIAGACPVKDVLGLSTGKTQLQPLTESQTETLREAIAGWWAGRSERARLRQELAHLNDEQFQECVREKVEMLLAKAESREPAAQTT